MIAILAILVVAQSVLADISTHCQDVANHKNLPLLPEVKTYYWQEYDLKVIGGVRAYAGQFPWMALLLKHSSPRGQPSEICDGTIISNKYIITSAHCVHDIMNPADLKVRLGAIHGTITEYKEHWSNDPPVTPVVDFTVEAITTHDLYNHETSQNDVALVRVHGAITFNEYIGPAALPLPCSIAMSNFTLYNQYIYIMGWRDVGDKGCSLWKQGYRERNYMCDIGTSTKGTSKCIGSSPMPIIYWNPENEAAYLIGSMSLQHACKLDSDRWLTLPGDLPSIFPFLPWILDNLRE